MMRQSVRQRLDGHLGLRDWRILGLCSLNKRQKLNKYLYWILPPSFTLSGGSWRRSGWWLRDQCSLLERPRHQIPPLSIMQLGWLGENYVWTIAAPHNQELTILESSKYASGSQWICKICIKIEAIFRFSKHKLLRWQTVEAAPSSAGSDGNYFHNVNVQNFPCDVSEN